MMNLILYIPLFLALYTVTIFLINKLKNHPPTPFLCFPIIGHLYLLQTPLHRTLATLSEAYGPAFFLRLGFRPVLVVSSQSAAKDCLSQNNLYQDNPNVLASKFIGHSNAKLLSALPCGQQWRTLRRLLFSDCIYSGCLNLFSTARREEVKALIRRLHAQSSDDNNLNKSRRQGTKMKTMFYELTFRIIIRVIVGEEWCNGENCYKFGKVLEKMIEVGKSTNLLTNYMPFLGMFGNEAKLRKMFASVHGELDHILQNLINEQRTKMNSDENEEGLRESNENEKNKSMIQVMLSLQRKDPVLYSDGIIKNFVLVLLIAGIDTCSTTMEWAISLLLNNPRVLQKAQAEIDHNVGPTRLIDEPDRLPYFDCIIKETLRLYPPGPSLIPHVSPNGCVLEGRYHVPRGTLLLLNMWAIHNCAKTWDEPSKFEPERFEDWTKKEIGGYKFMDLGSGSSQSTVELMAISTGGTILGSILQCFDLEIIGETTVDMEEAALLTITKVKPLEALLRTRSEMLDLISRM